MSLKAAAFLARATPMPPDLKKRLANWRVYSKRTSDQPTEVRDETSTRSENSPEG